MYTAHGHHIPGSEPAPAPEGDPHPCGGLTNCHSCIRDATLNDKNKSRRTLIHELIQAGVLGPELVPEPDYWHWEVLKPSLLPDRFRHSYNTYGEVRWYGD